jgi:hypothetical protein
MPLALEAVAFADKREVLFGGQDMLAGLFSDAIRANPSSATTVDRLAAALESAAAAFTPHRHDLALCVPITSFTSCDQPILVDHATLEPGKMEGSPVGWAFGHGLDDMRARPSVR